MKPTKTLLLLAAVLAPLSISEIAEAQPGGYYAQPQSTQLPGGFHDRQGRMIFGFSLGLGSMEDSQGDIECVNCDYSSLSGQVSGHIGGFIGPRLALMAELQANVQTLEVDEYGDTITLAQSALMIAGQYWLTPQLWIKGGIGFASLDLDDSYYYESAHIDSGLAVMGGIGYEVFSSRNFSVDLQGRLIAGSYDYVDEQITAGSIGVGFNWF